MFKFLGDALRNGGVEQRQMDGQIGVDVVYLHEYIPNGYRDGQFLLTLPNQSLLLAFSRLHLATDKLPQQSSCFVGGKVEPGETREQALIRECQEELAVTVAVQDVFMEVDHVYPDLTVHLTLFNASITEGIPQKIEHNDLRWITVEEIDQYPFCPAGEEILRRLKEA